MGLTASNWARGDPVMADACEAPVWTEMGVWKGKGEWGGGLVGLAGYEGVR